MAVPLDVTAVRKHFPALDREQVYFDNAGGSQVLQEVVDSVSTYLATTNVQLGASYPIGQQSTKLYEHGFQSAAEYINATRDSIVLGSSTTQLYRNLSLALFDHITPGSEIILSTIDHEANLASWVQLASFRGATIKWWHPSFSPSNTTNPHLTPDSLRPLLSDKTKIVACTHTSNILGTITPVRAIADLVHTQPHALLCVDAVAYAPHREVDVQSFGVDFYAFSWYKIYGPHISMLYASKRGREAMLSLGHFFKRGRDLETLLGLAGASYELVNGVPAVVQYIQSLAGTAAPTTMVGAAAEGLKKLVVGQEEEDKDFPTFRARVGAAWTRVADHEQALQAKVLGYLTEQEPKHGRKITVWGETRADAALRVPVISFTVEGWKSRDLVLKVQERTGGRFGFRWGAFYSNRLVEDVLGMKDVDDGVVRVSLVHYNTLEEVGEFVDALDAVLREA
ncbi:PLP-dependent transferase [Myriangium duriaei CBS 260.36]|uniref:PLP-dependent transferase n=1 Tax=Myriangium duriaei CBS 260.36 TaxID=1168546 RepID=A0A9P4MJH5_9PEZI|nr:PLP-dependent transferase [Myriangium duriaei CBS 260.36]